jgi:threonine synthase
MTVIADQVTSFGRATHLACRACGTPAQLGAEYSCYECFGPLEVAYNFGKVSRQDIRSGPISIWRYAPLLPVPSNVAQYPNQGSLAFIVRTISPNDLESLEPSG